MPSKLLRGPTASGRGNPESDTDHSFVLFETAAGGVEGFLSL